VSEAEFTQPVVSGTERDFVIERAAAALDALDAHMGDGEEARPTVQGDYARDFKGDEATAKFPQIHRIDPEQLDRSRDDIPSQTAQLFNGARFYWITFPVRLYAPIGWGFNRLQARAQFASGGAVPGAVTFYLLPDPEFQTYFEGKEKVELGIDARLKALAGLPPFSAGAPGGPQVEFDGSGAAQVKVHTRYVFGPFEYRLTAAKVKHWGAGDDDARWLLNGARYLDEGDPGLRVMLRVPDDVEELTVRVSLEARRYFAALEASFQEKVKLLPAALANFFRNGTPIGSVAEFDLTPHL
jgi:hypothetical protein